MSQKTTFNTVAGIVFLVIAVMHLIRSIYGWEVTVDGVFIPIWCSYMGAVVSGILAYAGLSGSSRTM